MALLDEAIASPSGEAAALFEAAASGLKKVVSEESGTPDAVTAVIAFFHLMAKQGAWGHTPYLEALAATRSPEQSTALFTLIHVYQHQGDTGAARRVATSVRTLYPDDWRGRYGAISLAEMRIDEGRFGDAASILETLTDLSDDETDRISYTWDRLERESNDGYAREDYAGKRVISDDEPRADLSLFAHPNPFNPTTTIRFELQDRAQVHAAVFDLLGRQVAVLVNGPADAGWHSVNWDASALGSGTYFVILRTPDTIKSTKLLLLK
jgi:hypothetical protein